MQNGGVDMREFEGMLPEIQSQINGLYYNPRGEPERQKISPQEGRSLGATQNNSQRNYIDAKTLGINFR